jgi:transposase-like protein
MARPDQIPSRPFARETRYFSQEFKKKKVAELDKKVTTIAEICKAYEVSSTAVYKWIYKYSLMKKKGVKMLVESESDTVRINRLKQHINELEQLVGQKQFEIDFLQKQMEIASDQYNIDFKKKPSGGSSFGTGSTDQHTSIK